MSLSDYGSTLTFSTQSVYIGPIVRQHGAVSAINYLKLRTFAKVRYSKCRRRTLRPSITVYNSISTALQHLFVLLAIYVTDGMEASVKIG